MNSDEFRRHGHTLVDWIADYMEGVRDYPVRAQVSPGDVRSQLPAVPPEAGESFDAIMQDMDALIMPGITHWQHPRFFAYFPANVTPPSVLAEMLISSMGVNAMIWETSPAATELEEQMIDWLKGMQGLPADWSGTIQDTASTAVFCAALVAREKVTGWQINETGFQQARRLTVYTSGETHSSLEKAVKMAGLGKANIRYVPIGDDHAMDTQALEAMINQDKAEGCLPTMIVASVGATGMGAMDDIREIGNIARHHDIFYHIDGAWAGSAMICPEYRTMLDGVELADSYAFNPHKWMGVNFDCCAHFIRDKNALIRTLTILPEYLKTVEGVTDYRDWGVQLGRRNRALKLWFVIRSYGVEALQEKIRDHVKMAERLADMMDRDDSFDIVTKPVLSLFTFRVTGPTMSEAEEDTATEALLTQVNEDGYTYLTRTVIAGRPVIRWQVGQVNTTWEDVVSSWERVKEIKATQS